jgi:hypothetical protein
MGKILINPCDETRRKRGEAAPRLERLKGCKVALLDISKPGGVWFLDRIEELLKTRYGVAATAREVKPTYAKTAPPELIKKLTDSGFDGVIEALAD